MKHSLSSHKEMNVGLQVARLLDAIITRTHKSEGTLDYSCIRAHVNGNV